MNADKKQDVIDIQGDTLEGGGSILRVSSALSALTQKPFRITNIRANRDRPGLKPQHLTCLRILAELCSAKVEGARIGSSEVSFFPKEFCPENRLYKWDIGTAGSVSLVLQSLMIPAAFTGLEFEIAGGTNVKFSPPMDYLINVTLPVLEKMGYEADIGVVKRGFYPEGGGLVRGRIRRIEKLKPIKLIERESLKRICGASIVSGLPEHIALRQKESAEKILRLKFPGADINIATELSRGSSKGSAIVLWAECGNSVIGGDALGEIGKSAERIGEEAAKKLLEELRTNSAVDAHLADQLIPFIGIADGESEIRTTEITNHALANIHVAEKFLGPRFELSGCSIRAQCNI